MIRLLCCVSMCVYVCVSCEACVCVRGVYVCGVCEVNVCACGVCEVYAGLPLFKIEKTGHYFSVFKGKQRGKFEICQGKKYSFG